MDVLMQESGDSAHGLKRTLGKLNLITLGLGAIIGAGIFVLTGQAAAQYAGPAVSISFIVAGFACAFAGLCYAEFASMIPIAGSAYTYAYATMGRIVAWIIGWALILEYLFSGSTVAVGWSGYVVNYLDSIGLHIPETLSNAPIGLDVNNHLVLTGNIINLPAVLIVFLVTALLYRGIKESASFNNIVVLVKLVVIILFILLGWQYVNTENWVPFIPENTGEFGKFGWSGIMRASSVIFFAYVGFDAVSTAAQEAKNPQRDMPWGILGSLVICTVVYIIVSMVMTGIAPYQELNTSAPIAVAIDKAEGLAWFSPYIKIGAIAGLSSVILVMLMGQTRIFYSMAKDGLFFKRFGDVHEKYQTPYFATLITGGVALTTSGLLPIGILGELVSFGTLLAFIIVCLGILILRYQQPELKRPFKTPLFPVTPILGIICCLGVMFSLNTLILWIALIWRILGLLVYYGYGSNNAMCYVRS
jgi:APA family basic amino acid/polyamine antiporter